MEDFTFEALEAKREDINLKFTQRARTINRRRFHELKKRDKFHNRRDEAAQKKSRRSNRSISNNSVSEATKVEKFFQETVV